MPRPRIGQSDERNDGCGLRFGGGREVLKSGAFVSDLATGVGFRIEGGDVV